MIFFNKADQKCKIYYIYELTKFNFHKFDTILSKFNSSNLGLILVIDKNSFNLSQLNLKELIVYINSFNFEYKILGLPKCVILKYLDSFDYMQLSYLFEFESSYFEFSKKISLNSTQLIECKKCEWFRNCTGLGNLSENLNLGNFRLRQKIRVDSYKSLIFKDKVLNSTYNQCINHISKYNLNYTERYLKFAKVFSKYKNQIYDERFVYFCRGLRVCEINEEKLFLLNLSKNKQFVNRIFDNLYKNLLLKGYAYTIATKENIFRETFYLYFVLQEHYIDYLKNILNIKLQINDFEEYYDLSFDFLNNEPEDFKVYTKVINIDSFFNYLKDNFNFNFDIEIIEKSFNFFFVRRYDKNGNLKGVKFEFNTIDVNLILLKLNQLYNLNIEKDKILTEEIFAPDIDLNGKLNKITLYYRNF